MDRNKILVEFSHEDKEKLIKFLKIADILSLKIRRYSHGDRLSNYKEILLDDIDCLFETKSNIIRKYDMPPVVSAFLGKDKSKYKKSKLPTGISHDKTNGGYQVSCYIDGIKKKVGRFSDPQLAFLAYKEAKEAEAKRVAQHYYDRSEIDKETYDALMCWEVKS